MSVNISMNILSFTDSHDTTLGVYSVEQNKYWIFEFEKIFGEKFYDTRKLVTEGKDQKVFEDVDTAMHDFVYPITGIRDFDLFARPWDASYARKWKVNTFHKFEDFDVKVPYKFFRYTDYLTRTYGVRKTIAFDHHRSHAASAFYQSPFEKAVMMVNDGYGDKGSNGLFLAANRKEPIKFIKKLNIIQKVDQRMSICTFYGQAGRYLPIINNCGVGDNYRLMWNAIHGFAGKLMGLSSYGTMKSEIAKTVYWNARFGFLTTLDKELSFEEQANIACAIQNAFTDELCAQVKRYLKFIVNEGGGNLCLSGGGGLNVIANQAVQERFPRLKVYVPPNPDDCGIVLGALFSAAALQGADMSPNVIQNFNYGGIEIQDQDRFEEFCNGRKVQKVRDVRKITDKLNAGMIFGVVQGPHELGKRALGNRSIIANASIKGMKDKINVIKNREWYRPFAPMCRDVDAERIFEAAHYDNLDVMGFTVWVREQYREKYESITHVDGTARLQVVNNKKQTKLMYELLTHVDGNVLLNTSFNVARKPILNTYKEAFQVLDDTALDGLVIKHKNVLYLVEK